MSGTPGSGVGVSTAPPEALDSAAAPLGQCEKGKVLLQGDPALSVELP